MRFPRFVRRALAAPVVLALVGTALLAVPRTPEAQDPPSVRTTTRAVPDGALDGGTTLPLTVEGGPELIAFTWESTDEATIEVRARDRAGWSPWTTLEGHGEEGPDTSTAEWSPRGHAGPAFLGRDITEIELRLLEGDAPGLVVHAIDSEPDPSALRTVPAAVASPPPITTRAQWGADETWRGRSAGCSGRPDYADGIRLGVVHHTVGSNTYTAAESPAIIRGIYDFHVRSNGWCDIGYNFLVDRFGQIFEGRFGGIRRATIGGHASGFNSLSTGVAVLGDFTSSPVPAAAYEALVEIFAFKLAYHGVDPQGSSSVTVGSNSSAKWPEGTTVTLPNLEGHGDSNRTSCPGAELYARLPQLRQDVAQAISTRGLQRAFTLERLAGEDRFATAAAIARASFGSAGVAYLARADGFADALAANHAAGHASAPILLANTGGVPPTTLQALRDLGTTTVRLLGGTGALGPEVETALRGAGLAVERMAGEDRWATAAVVARSAGAQGVGADPSGRRTAVLSSGVQFADALAAGGIVFGAHLPQLLSEPGSLPAATASALTDLAVQHVLITGGTGALSNAVEAQVQALGLTTERIAGATRYETALALADLAVDRFGYSASHIDVATGESFPDALTGGTHAGRTRSPLLLTPRSDLPPGVCGFVQRRGGVTAGHLLGGRGAVDGGVKATLEECIQFG